ncbi:coiled-coil domain-containing protein 12-like [Ctenocephalides felis]|uniref:coiled-coil domain-containing protein 12-like n=1 Tax=Ctenocephalides felis TaxID=7515 RepID=UPI000E6E18F2|nr:coiled-coil domain-containing protein 12-like [Ctenocephalides felis]
MTTDIKVGSLEEEALKRKERLRALKRKTDQESSSANNSSISESLPKPIFRSYKPQDEQLQENTIPDTKPCDIESEVQEQLESAKTAQTLIEDLDITNLAPRKPDWDLKRDIAKKLDKLERRTQRAIAELIRERLKSGKEDLSTIVNVAAITNDKAADVDEE